MSASNYVTPCRNLEPMVSSLAPTVGYTTDTTPLEKAPRSSHSTLHSILFSLFYSLFSTLFSQLSLVILEIGTSGYLAQIYTDFSHTIQTSIMSLWVSCVCCVDVGVWALWAHFVEGPNSLRSTPTSYCHQSTVISSWVLGHLAIESEVRVFQDLASFLNV